MAPWFYDDNSGAIVSFGVVNKSNKFGISNYFDNVVHPFNPIVVMA